MTDMTTTNSVSGTDDSKKPTLFSTKLGEIRFSIDSIDAPALGLITSSRVTQSRDENGSPIAGTISKVVFHCVDLKVAKLFQTQGLDLSAAPIFTVELISNFDYMKQISEKELVGKAIDLRQAKVALRWVSRGNSGSWGGLKLILETLAIPTTKTN